MVRHLSAAWIEALDHAVKASAELRAGTAEAEFTIQQVVTCPDGDVTYYLAVDHGAVSVHPGRAAHADLVFTQDEATAEQIIRGDLSAQAAFMVGRLRVGGNLTVLLDQQDAILSLDDVFAGVRARTELAPVDPPPAAEAEADRA